MKKIEPYLPADKQEILYVGDPMCSWCWGIAPALIRFRDYCMGLNINFRVFVGGLSSGGNVRWDDSFKETLRRHWSQVAKRTGQKFNDELLSYHFFDYNTEPACRAVVVARTLDQPCELDFLEAMQYKFYVESADPSQESFYQSICDKFGFSYPLFLEKFQSEEMRKRTTSEFDLVKSWGIKGFPSLLLLDSSELRKIAYGYSTFERMVDQLDHYLF